MTWLQSCTKVLATVMQIHIFLSFLGSLVKQCILFKIFLQFSLPPPPPSPNKVKLGTNSQYTRPTLFMGWREGLDLCELEKAPEMQNCPKTFVYDCSFKLEELGCLYSSGHSVPFWSLSAVLNQGIFKKQKYLQYWLTLNQTVTLGILASGHFREVGRPQQWFVKI